MLVSSLLQTCVMCVDESARRPRDAGGRAPRQRRKSCMTQKAATMAMKIRVVWTMGSGIPIVAAYRVVTEEGAC